MSTISLPRFICHLHGVKPGPRVVVFGGTHGDETTGVEVIKTILQSLGFDFEVPNGSHRLPFVNGDLFLGIGNPEAVAKNTRSVSGVRDLNRCFHEQFFEDPKEMKLADQKRAAELTDLLADADYFFDLHSVSAPNSIPFIGLTTFSEKHARVCKLFPVSYVVNVNFILAQDVGINEKNLEQAPTTCSWVNRHGGVGLAFEMGFQKDFTSTPRALQIILNVLKEIGSIDEEFVKIIGIEIDESIKKQTKQHVFRLIYCERNKFKSFQFADDRFTQNWLSVRSGELVGKYEDGEEVRVPQDGVLIFVAGKHTLNTNPSLFYLAVLEYE
ncbi:succinylglutamate desuccinylase/aspartoacylase family protein [Candidatus Falkowbacteria bacterium]|nr:succinylglutamate desuccinylase/aspartoacylase family protein [Candidatus Falkowbacteria bacterium]